jgi:hypothetical protein
MWMVYFVVQNYDESEKKAKELGARIIMGPHEVPGVGKFAIVKDPQGAYMSIMQMASKP